MVAPALIFDKSALHALNMDEAVWLEAFFNANVVPVFFVETVADLEKKLKAGRSAEDLVGGLAAKTPANAVPNVHHRELVFADLAGFFELALDGRPVVGDGDLRQAPDGKVGFHFDETPEAEALLRWRNHEFLEVERGIARSWRPELARADHSRLVGTVKNILPGEKISDLTALKAFIDTFCASDDLQVLLLAFEVFEAPDKLAGLLRERWEERGGPALEDFAPYATHVLKVELLFYLGLHCNLISDQRPSHRVDFAYLYYLPFCDVFVSGDRLHHETVPLFLKDEQAYLETTALKEALADLNQHYVQLPDSIKELGVMAFASYPPADFDNAVTRIWDARLSARWRESARRREVEVRDPAFGTQRRRPPEDVKSKMEEAQTIEGEPGAPAPDDADYLMISRRVPAEKGSWRIVPRSIEDQEQ